MLVEALLLGEGGVSTEAVFPCTRVNPRLFYRQGWVLPASLCWVLMFPLVKGLLLSQSTSHVRATSAALQPPPEPPAGPRGAGGAWLLRVGYQVGLVCSQQEGWWLVWSLFVGAFLPPREGRVWPGCLKVPSTRGGACDCR